MADQPDRKDEDDALLERANALLARHRGPAKPGAAPGEGPTPAEPAADADIPTLTEIIPAERLPALTVSSGEVISRVQAQNLEHSVYLKLRRELDQKIAQMMRDRIMPDVGAVLDAALAKISGDLKSGIDGMVRASIEESLRTQIKNLRMAVDVKAALAPGASATMPAFSESSSSAMTLAKSFEPAAIESRWYSSWEKAGYFQAGLDESNPNRYCILLPPPTSRARCTWVTRSSTR